MSTLTEEGIMDVRNTACDRLLAQRVEAKWGSMKESTNVLNRLHLAVPVPRDERNRPAHIPETVIDSKSGMKEDKEVPELREDINFFQDHDDLLEDPTTFSIDWRKDYILANDEWKFDIRPEIIDGKVVADFIDENLDEKLTELEREEEEKLKDLIKLLETATPELTDEQLEQLRTIKSRRDLIRLESRLRRSVNHSRFNRSNHTGIKVVDEGTLNVLEQQLEQTGVTNATEVVDRVRSRSRSRSRSVSRVEKMKKEGRSERSLSPRAASRSRSRSRALSMTPKPGEGFRDASQKAEAIRRVWRGQKHWSGASKAGEGDRRIVCTKPPHLFIGKRTIGKTTRR